MKLIKFRDDRFAFVSLYDHNFDPMEKLKIPRFKNGNIITRASDFFKDPLQFLTEKAELMGDFYKVSLLHKHIFITSHPEVIDHVLRVNHRNFGKSAMSRQLALAFGNGLITSEGDLYRKQHRLIQPAFRRNSMGLLFDNMLEATNRFFYEFEQKALSKKSVEIVQEMKDATATIAMKAFFSSDKASEQKAMSRILTSTQDYFFHRLEKPYMIPFSFFSKRRKLFYENKERFDKGFYRLIAERRSAKQKPDDLLTTLMDARDESTGKGMSDKQLRDEMVTLFVAGHETTAIGLSWTLYCLANNPAVLANLRKEIDNNIGKRAIGFNDISKLSYTRQIIEEGMRLYPPIWAISRQVVDNDQILGYHLPAGSMILINVYGLHRDATYWDHPCEFNPNRFDPNKQRSVNNKYYIPFGYGPRVCVGKHFAMTEMILMLATFVQRFNFRLVEGQLIKPKVVMTLQPEEGILMHIEPV